MNIQVLVFEKFLGALHGTGSIDIEDEDIVLFTDASDVLLNTNLQELESRYISMERNNTVLVNGETVCFPSLANCYTNPPLYADPARPPSPFKYANSGCWLARWHVAKRFIPIWADYIRHYSTTLRFISVSKSNATDQGALHMYAREARVGVGLARKHAPDPPQIQVDSESVIFQSTLNTALNGPQWRMARRGEVYVNPTSGSVHNTLTGTNPLLLHFNGVIGKAYVKTIGSYLSRLHVAREGKSRNISERIDWYYEHYPELRFCQEYFQNTLMQGMDK